MFTATFTPEAAAEGTIFQQAEGHALAVNLPSGVRVVLLVSKADAAKVGRERFTVTDLMTGFKHKLVRADCGLGCRCAVSFAEVR